MEDKESTSSSPIDRQDQDSINEKSYARLQPERTRTPKLEELRPIKSQRSYGGEDGYSCRQESIDIEPGERNAEESRFDVKFSGDDDPDSPRSRSKLRKWIVVLIMAGSALNV